LEDVKIYQPLTILSLKYRAELGYQIPKKESLHNKIKCQEAMFGDRIPVGGEIFRTCPDRPCGPPSLLYNGYRVFFEGKERPGREADPSPPSSAVVMKEQSYTSTSPMGRTACTEPQCLYKCDLYLFFHQEAIRANESQLITILANNKTAIKDSDK
jgi:hypothetical protein